MDMTIQLVVAKSAHACHRHAGLEVGPPDEYQNARPPRPLWTEFQCDDSAWAGADGEGIRVCVLDSGVDGAHPMVEPIEQAPYIVTQHGSVPRLEECEPIDTAGHGTACAGIIRSIAPRASLSSIRVLNDGRFGTGASLIAGLAAAIEEGFDVISMSLSTSRPEYRNRLAELCDRAYFRRCIVAVAAHNLPIESFPWNFALVISVASHADPDPMRFYYSSAPPVEFCARGVRVPVASPGGGTTRNTGNSFAAPHIARIAGAHPEQASVAHAVPAEDRAVPLRGKHRDPGSRRWKRHPRIA